ncbi:MAG: chorismate-binding protein [Myxococcota bacterium]
MSPSLEAVESHRGDETHVALSVTLLADTLTPISLYEALSAGRRRSFLLESVVGGDVMGRYSFVGADIRGHLRFSSGEVTVTRSGSDGAAWTRSPCGDPLEVLQTELSAWRVWSPRPLPRFIGGAVGYLGFDCVRSFEPRVSLARGVGLGAPDGELLLADSLAVYDHVSRRVTLIVHASLRGDRAVSYAAAVERLHAMVGRLSLPSRPPEAPWVLPAGPLPPVADVLPLTTNRTREDMEAAVRQAKAAIEAGEVFQVVPSLRITAPVQIAPLTLYRALRAVNPSPYMFLLGLGERSLVGASPEVLVRLEGDDLLVRPIAGTRRRGETAEEDAALAADLLSDEKELAEHRMLVDLGRNDLGRIAARGTVRVEDREHIERYAHVMHIVSDVRAKLRAGLDAFDVFRACFPAGTVSGAPKVRACAMLSELEPDRRGPYAGAVGYFGVDGSLDTCIAIRTLVVDDAGVHVQAGAGVVHDSVPSREHAECQRKALSCLRALQLALVREGRL